MVLYDVTFHCANDAQRDTFDFRFSAAVDRSALDGKADTNPADHVRPRNSASSADRDNGPKKPDGTLGGEILTDGMVQ